MKEFKQKDARRLYRDLAWTWPIISPPEHYIEETEMFAQMIRENSQILVKTVLNLGCGGGHNDMTLKKHFQVTSVDISKPMLELARKLNPEITYHIGDMRSVRLDKLFDAVIILDSINYMTTKEDLRAAFVTAFEHLKPGGVFLTVVEVTPVTLQPVKTSFSTHTSGDVTITFIENYYYPERKEGTYEATFIYLVRREGKLKIETDHHICGIFELKTWLRLLKDIGFVVKQMKFEHSTFTECESYPMLVCTKPLKPK